MPVGEKDIKILWGRAMGRCSMPDCRKKLLVDASEHSPSRTTVVGDNCHIVGEKASSPRGHSALSPEDRDRYPNLILLCREHHKIIDDDHSAWPIERLHQIKGDHEVWVEGLVVSEEDDPIRQVYVDLANRATEELWLRRWLSVAEMVLADTLPIAFHDDARQFVIDVHRTVWPGTYPALEAECVNLADRVAAFLDTFEKCVAPYDGLLKLDRQRFGGARSTPESLAVHNTWQAACNRLLMNVTHALNVFAAQVRKDLQPTYFISEGKFFVYDSLGVMSDLESRAYFPGGYDDDKQVDAALGGKQGHAADAADA